MPTYAQDEVLVEIDPSNVLTEESAQILDNLLIAAMIDATRNENTAFLAAARNLEKPRLSKGDQVLWRATAQDRLLKLEAAKRRFVLTIPTTTMAAYDMCLRVVGVA